MTENNNKKEPLVIEVTELQEFGPVIDSTAIMTTQKLAKRINKLFNEVFADYHGSVVNYIPGNGNVNPNQAFVVELHFKPVPLGAVSPTDDRVRAFKPIEESTPKDVIAGIKNIYGSMRSSSKFQMTEEASQLLAEFMTYGVNVDPFKPSSYDNLKHEYMIPGTYGNHSVAIKVLGFDLLKLIKKIYGAKKDGKRVDYTITPHSPMNPTANTTVNGLVNWRVVVKQLVSDNVYDTASEMGIIPADANNGMVVTGF